jgi:predicted sulfurtransferase
MLPGKVESNYAKQIKRRNLESKFIEKNFVFDHRLGEKNSTTLYPNATKPDVHTNCINEGCHLLFNVKNVHKRCKVAAHKTV